MKTVSKPKGWQMKRLRELFRVKHGYAFKSEHFTTSGDYILLTPGNFNDEGGFKLKGEKEKFYVGPIMPAFVLQRGDLLVAMTEQAEGLLGSSLIVPESNRFLHNQRLGLVTDIRVDAIDKHFLYYLFNSRGVRNQIRGSASGVKIRHTSPERIGEVEVTIPPVPAQKKIAGILSAYDDLIENNTRRIQILGQMAQTIYREWFVHFRFPGHKRVKLVESQIGKIPQAWEVARLGEHLIMIETGKRPKGGVSEAFEGVPSIGAENINGIGRHDFTKEKFVSHEFFEHMRKGVVHDRDVAIYKDGAYIGKSSYFRDGFPHSDCCVNEHVFLLRASGVHLTQNALYLWLRQPETVQAIHATNANAAQPGINQQSVNGLELIVPESNIAAQFDGLVEPMLAGIVNFAKRNQTLRRTRDLLLPKLISGELDVSELEIDVRSL